MNKALAMILAALAFAAFAVDTNRVTMTRLGSLNPRSGEVVTDVDFSGIAMTGDVARVEGKVDGMTNTFLRLSGGELSGDLVVLPGVPYAVRLGKSPYTNFYGNGIWWGDEMGLAYACGIVCESPLGNIHFVSQGNIISLPSSHGTLALQSEIPTTMAWSAITGKPSWIGNSKPSYTASEVGAIPTTGGVFNASLHLNQKLSVGTWTSSVKPYDISGGSGIAFVFGDNVQTKRSNTMTLGVGALNTNEWSFIWNGDANRMYIPGFPAMSNPYATRYNGGFHVNPSVRSGMVNPLQNFWIGDTNLNDWISALAPTPTWDTLSGKPTFATVATSGAYSDLSGKPTIPTTAADVGAVSTNGATMTGALVMEAPIVIRGAGLAGVQFSDTVLYVLDENGLPSRILTYSEIAQTSDIPTSMAWGSITGKPTTLFGYGITDALKSDFTSLTNNAAFTSAVAAVSPPTDLTHVEAEIETNRTAIATLSARAYIEVVSADEVYYVFTTNQE